MLTSEIPNQDTEMIDEITINDFPSPPQEKLQPCSMDQQVQAEPDKTSQGALTQADMAVKGS